MNLFKKNEIEKKNTPRQVLDEKVSDLESRVFKKKEKQKLMGDYFGMSIFTSTWFGTEKTLEDRVESLRTDFNELDKKFDALERYLQIEYYKEDIETQVYDWADKKHSEGFRKTKLSYDKMKEEKTKKEEDSCCCD